MMDEKRYLRQQINHCRRKLNIAKFLDSLVVFAALAGVAGIVCELVSVFVPFYYAHWLAFLFFFAGALTGSGYALLMRADQRTAAKRLDSFGLKERMLTACELMDREDAMARRQRTDALVSYNAVREQVKLPVLPHWKHLLALALSVALAAGLAFVPSAAREEARARHELALQAKEEKEKVSELLDALKGVDMDSLTEQQQEALQELMEAMELSREELSAAGSAEALSAAMERLDYKYEQAGQSLAQLASLLSDPEGLGVANAEALAKALANQSGEQVASGGTPTGSSGDGEGSGDGGGSGSGSEAGDGKAGNGNGDGSGDGGGSGNGDGKGNGSGDGSGNGNGTGSGDGSGSGSGSGNGNGFGGGRGTGSSDAVHDYVSIPNAIGDDSSLTGDKTGDENSDYYRQQNGLSWEGEHVDYSSVVGEYAGDAYEGIANGKYPSGMESVIRDYFDILNQ
ncbi:MAG: hypothetical protein NC355_01395 [Blautia sp.]|nr:hypothetical protein [Blautia sp.]